jgi:hypothetical protein
LHLNWQPIVEKNAAVFSDFINFGNFNPMFSNASCKLQEAKIVVN